MSEKKRNTHRQIVSDAARLFRERGYAACGVDAVMAAAGLTAGGFYSHFKNKDALLSEALEQCFAGPPAKVGHPVPSETHQPLENWVQRYASEIHRDHPSAGCAIPTLAAEVARQGSDVQSAFTHAFLKQVNALAGKSKEGSDDEKIDAVLLAIAAAAGAVLLARAVSDPELSARLLRVVRDAYPNEDGE